MYLKTFHPQELQEPVFVKVHGTLKMILNVYEVFLLHLGVSIEMQQEVVQN